jgi:hypothetical protein
MKLEFSRQIFEITQVTNFMKICPVGAELFHADGQTDRQAGIHDEAYLNFTKTPKNGSLGVTSGKVTRHCFLSRVPSVFC